jgi:transposase
MSGHRTNPPHVTMSTRRIWSAAEKRAIVAEAEERGATVSMVARRHNLHSSLLFRWRRDVLAKTSAVGGASQGPRPAQQDRVACGGVSSQPAFIPLALTGPVNPPQPAPAAAGMIEIELASGHRLRTEGNVDATVLRGVIEALVGR